MSLIREKESKYEILNCNNVNNEINEKFVQVYTFYKIMYILAQQNSFINLNNSIKNTHYFMIKNNDKRVTDAWFNDNNEFKQNPDKQVNLFTHIHTIIAPMLQHW